MTSGLGSSIDYSGSETWRTETFLHALMEFWFNQNSLVPKEMGLRQQVQVSVKRGVNRVIWKCHQNVSSGAQFH